MKIFITYLLLVLGVLSMEINVPMIDECSICFEEFNKLSRTPIILHKVNNVNHTFCKTCVISLMNDNIIRCPNCRYELKFNKITLKFRLKSMAKRAVDNLFLYRDELKICMKTLLTIVNLVIPAFLSLDKGFIMALFHFVLRASTQLYISFPMMIVNSVLFHQEHQAMGEAMGEAIWPSDALFLSPSILSIIIMITFPAIGELIRLFKTLLFPESQESDWEDYED